MNCLLAKGTDKVHILDRKDFDGGHPSSTRQVPDKYPTSIRQVLAALAKAGEPLTRAALQEASGLRDREHFVNQYLNPMVNASLIQLTIPDKPRSSKQRYFLTDAGRAYLQKHKAASKVSS